MMRAAKKPFSALRFFTAALALFLLSLSAARADRLADIERAGVLKAAVFDSNPPFGFVDAQTRQIVGLDADYARAIAAHLGVKAQLVAVNPAGRIPSLLSGRADLVLANFTVSPERARQADFSIPYFKSGQQFIAPKGKLKDPAQLNAMRIGADKGTVNEINLKKLYPKARIISYDDTPFAFAALRSGNVQAITQDGPKLAGLLARVPDKAAYEIPKFSISQDYQAAAAPKGETRLVDKVNAALRAMEADGEAAKIYDKWFGPNSETPLPRDFKIGDKA